jgi:hypothetical protein
MHLFLFPCTLIIIIVVIVVTTTTTTTTISNTVSALSSLPTLKQFCISVLLHYEETNYLHTHSV